MPLGSKSKNHSKSGSGCTGFATYCTFAGTYFQQVDSTGSKVGQAFSADDVYVAGDMVTMSDGRICWPYVNMTWDLSQSIDDSSSSATGKKMSIACVGLDGATDSPTTTAASVTTSATAKVAITEGASAVIKAASSETTVKAPTQPLQVQPQSKP